MTGYCPYGWATHGCDLPPDHGGEHVCLGVDGDAACDSRQRGDRDVFHCVTNESEVTA